jgi:dTDP-4-dehydrorhamnose 3,5-epimerase-like enzyme
MLSLPKIIQGKVHSDFRGALIHFNEFDLDPVKRFYTVVPTGIHIVRAWQGHKYEQKWFYVLTGSFKIVIVQPDDWECPDTKLIHREYILSSDSNKVLHIPGGVINGFKAMEPESRLMVFSDLTLEESIMDDFRFDSDLWYQW